jgi:hypothetical protein
MPVKTAWRKLAIATSSGSGSGHIAHVIAPGVRLLQPWKRTGIINGIVAGVRNREMQIPG